MKRRIHIVILKMALIAIVAALLMDQLFVRVIIPGQHDFSNVKKIQRLIDTTEPEEIPIFGSSVAKRSYLPDSIGHDIFNYGMAGSVFLLIEPLLKIELEKDKETPIIIDFEHHFFVSHKEVRVQLSNFIPHVANPHIRTMLEERKLLRRQYDVPGLRLYGQYDDYLLDLMRLYVKLEYANNGGLFFKPKQKDFSMFEARRQRIINELKDLRATDEAHPELLNTDKRYKMELLDVLLNSRSDPEYIERFENLVSQNPHREFILVYSPQHPIKLIGLENHREVQDLLQRLDTSHDNLTILDHSLSQFEDDYFHDSGHMNMKGAIKFSRILREDLKSRFPERKNLWSPKLLEN